MAISTDQYETSPTREVLNQPPPLQPVDFYAIDAPLQEAVARGDGAWGTERLHTLAALAGTDETREHARRAERNAPVLTPYDRFGHRIDEVELDPSWHWLLATAIEHGLHAGPWREPQPGAHVVRGAQMMLWNNANNGVLCPVSMTHAVVPALRDGAPELAAKWEPRITSGDYA